MALSPSLSLSRVLHVRNDFTTTTIFADPTSLGSQGPPDTRVPVAAIAGGSVAGVVLAVLAVIGWKYWGVQIKKREREEQEKRKAIQAAMAYRRSVLSGRKNATATATATDPRRSRPPSSRSLSDRTVKFAASPAAAPLDQISSPRPLRPRTTSGDKDIPPVPPLPITLPATSPRAGLLDSKNSYKPLRPSPLARPRPPSPRFPRAEMHHPAVPQYISSDHPITTQSEKPASITQPPSASGRIPRTKASLSSLTGEARRQSKASHNSASDQSRLSSTTGSTRRWSWWSLINGPSFSFRQIGVGTGKNRLSADTSLYTEWHDEDPTLPIGYAYSGVDDGELHETAVEINDQNSYVLLDSSGPSQTVEKDVP